MTANLPPALLPLHRPCRLRRRTCPPSPPWPAHRRQRHRQQRRDQACPGRGPRPRAWRWPPASCGANRPPPPAFFLPKRRWRRRWKPRPSCPRAAGGKVPADWLARLQKYQCVALNINQGRHPRADRRRARRRLPHRRLDRQRSGARAPAARVGHRRHLHRRAGRDPARPGLKDRAPVFSYRHAFHAGNHADVLKHAILVHTLDYFNRGRAVLGHRHPCRRRPVQPGRRLGHQDRRVRRRHRPALGARRPAAHPGRVPAASRLQHQRPAAALSRLAVADAGCAASVGPAAHVRDAPDRDRHAGRQPGTLDRNAQRQTTIYGDDGFEGVKALLPRTRRGMVLIDPS